MLMMFSKSRGAQTVAITVAERVAANNPDFTWEKQPNVMFGDLSFNDLNIIK